MSTFLSLILYGTLFSTLNSIPKKLHHLTTEIVSIYTPINTFQLSFHPNDIGGGFFYKVDQLHTSSCESVS